MTASMTPPPGWYPDPRTEDRNRYWDGQSWTEATGPVVAATIAPWSQEPATQRPSPAAVRLPYHPAGLHLLGRWTQALLVVSAFWYAVSALAAAGALRPVGDGTAPAGQAASAQDAHAMAAGVALLFLLPAGVVFIVWMFRYWGQLRIVRSEDRPRHGRGWTIGGWFVPVANLWIPKQLIDDYWRRTSAAVGDPHLTRVWPGVHWWWAAWLLGNAVENAAYFTDVSEGGSGDAYYLLAAIGAALSVAAAILGTLVVGRLVERLSSMVGYRP
jgi:hypothetical protein